MTLNVFAWIIHTKVSPTHEVSYEARRDFDLRGGFGRVRLFIVTETEEGSAPPRPSVLRPDLSQLDPRAVFLVCERYPPNLPLARTGIDGDEQEPSHVSPDIDFLHGLPIDESHAFLAPSGTDQVGHLLAGEDGRPWLVVFRRRNGHQVPD
ncbi:hypothetical protein [Sinorhizobium fredii]|uniref:hypothetical protein n=1 Tax=Rhizobium fredii TaxID=380 RepID=UPI00138B1B8F|nr:hypothetical protein [Sinorhizobium fredii]